MVLVSTDEVDDYVKLIKDHLEEVKKAERRVDNADLFSNENTNPIDYGRFNYVIVGAGSAGAIVAKRLADHGERTLLIEAGEKPNLLTDIPGISATFLFSNYSWGYLSEPQKYGCQGMVDKKCAIQRGKSVGGSGTINDVMYVRGNKLDQSLWSKNGSIKGWSYDDVLPYYKRWENYASTEFRHPEYHGFTGPISIEHSRPAHILARSFIAANRELGIDYNKDYNGQYQMGTVRTQYFKQNGRRVSSGNTYLRGNTKYLTVITKTLAYKILFRNGNKRRNITADRIEFFKDNKRYSVQAEKEVILCASTFNNAQLLMLSGIGPKDELAKHNIPLVQDLPVGQNLQDHVSFSGLTFVSDLMITDPKKDLEEHVWEFLSGTGRLSDTNRPSLAFYSVTGNNTIPDVEVILSSSGKPLFSLKNTQNLNPENLKVLANLPQEKINNIFHLGILLLHPKSTGSLKLKSNSIKDFPAIDLNLFSHPDDLEVLYKAILKILQLLETDSFKKLNVQLLKQVLPACKDLEYKSKEYWFCTLKQLAAVTSHTIGSCRIGLRGTGVVDNKLKVYGVSGLRIADISVVPQQISGHANGLALMIGEKAADIILGK